MKSLVIICVFGDENAPLAVFGHIVLGKHSEVHGNEHTLRQVLHCTQSESEIEQGIASYLVFHITSFFNIELFMANY